MRLIASLLLAATCALAQSQNTLTRSEIEDGWILLFDGESLFGWTPEMKAQWHVQDGSIVGDAGEYGWLRNNATFADFTLKCDFKTAADGNSGLFLRSAKEGAPHETGYELQIFDGHPKFPTGSLVNSLATKEGHIKSNEWQTMEVTAQGDHFVVRLDGKTILDGHDSKAAVGHIGLQYNKNKPVAFRNIKLKPLGMLPMFHAGDLSGWHRVEAAKPPAELPVWSMKDGVLHVQKGPGSLESDRQAKDFVVQIDVKANAPDKDHHPNSGVFSRGTPGVFWSGYEAQIRNEYKGGDRTQVVDFGTGAIYRHQPARKIVANDDQWFTMTIDARDHHYAVYVDGYQVTDFEDTNPVGTNVRANQTVLGPGIFSLQAHDPTTNLDFRNMSIEDLPDKK